MALLNTIACSAVVVIALLFLVMIFGGGTAPLL